MFRVRIPQQIYKNTITNTSTTYQSIISIKTYIIKLLVIFLYDFIYIVDDIKLRYISLTI